MNIEKLNNILEDWSTIDEARCTKRTLLKDDDTLDIDYDEQLSVEYTDKNGEEKTFNGYYNRCSGDSYEFGAEFNTGKPDLVVNFYNIRSMSLPSKELFTNAKEIINKRNENPNWRP